VQSPDEILEMVISRWRDDPVLFVEEGLGATPTEQQKKLLRAIAKPGAHVSATSGHGVGKSSVLAWIVLWHCICFYPSKTGCTAPTAHQLKDVLWAEVAFWRSKLPPWLRDQVIVSSDRLCVLGHEETQFAVARTARPENPEALQGLHSEHMLFVIDEASGVADAVFQPIEGALSTPNARIVMASNPTQTSGYLFLAHHRNAAHWVLFEFSCLESPLVSPEYATKMRESYGEDSDIYKVRVLGKFPSASITQLIPYDLASAATKRKLHPSQYQFAPIAIGVDPAWEGDDRSCIYLRQGLASRLLYQKIGIDNMTLAGLVAQYEDEHKADAVFIDVGWGAGVIDRLRQLGRSPTPVNFGGRSGEERYVNKRTEMWCNLKKWLADGGVIPDNSELVEDLVGPQYGFCSNGKIQLEAKKDMKKRGLRSPDLADALALTFAEQVRKLEGVEVVAGASPSFAKTEYNFLG
jgi:hypothetical protein